MALIIPIFLRCFIHSFLLSVEINNIGQGETTADSVPHHENVVTIDLSKIRLWSNKQIIHNCCFSSRKLSHLNIYFQLTVNPGVSYSCTWRGPLPRSWARHPGCTALSWTRTHSGYRPQSGWISSDHTFQLGRHATLIKSATVIEYDDISMDIQPLYQQVISNVYCLK